MSAYRARRYLDRFGISLSDLVAFAGRSKTTWSRALGGEREHPNPEWRDQVESVIRGRGHELPADLWEREGKSAARASVNPRKGELRMQAQSISPAALKAFKLFRSPFDPEAIVGADGVDRLDELHLPVTHRFVEERVVQALTHAGFLALHGEVGSGKSTLMQRALRRAGDLKPLVVVTPANVERRKLTAMHISAEIIRQLSESSVPRTANVRDALAEEVLTQRYAQGQRVALLIDEAHELPNATIKDLKRFHEMMHGFMRLISIVMVGQPELERRFDLERNYQLREAIIRCQLVKLPAMKGEVAGYLATRFDWVGARVADVFEPTSIEEIERRLEIHGQQYPVLIGNVATAAMNIAARRGNPRVTPEDVAEVWSFTPEQLQEIGL